MKFVFINRTWCFYCHSVGHIFLQLWTNIKYKQHSKVKRKGLLLMCYSRNSGIRGNMMWLIFFLIQVSVSFARVNKYLPTRIRQEEVGWRTQSLRSKAVYLKWKRLTYKEEEWVLQVGLGVHENGGCGIAYGIPLPFPFDPVSERIWVKIL